ncbi:MAG: hypothetical protein V4654_14325, partial [Bdellovibrionota bacterium]
MKKFILGFVISFLTLTVSAEELKFAVLGDAGRWNTNAQIVQTSILKYNTHRLIMPGDNLYSGTYEKVWAPWKSAGFTYDVIAIGNHTLGYAKEVKFFEMPGEFFSKSYLNGDLQFLVLNSDNTANVNQQMTWFEQQLQNSTAKQVFVVYHHPSLTIGEHL